MSLKLHDVNPRIVNKVLGLGDTLQPITAVLKRRYGSAAVDLTGYTFVFNAYDDDGTQVVTDGSVTVTDAANGLVSYSPGASDFATVGRYWGYFVGTLSGKEETWPVDGRKFAIDVCGD